MEISIEINFKRPKGRQGECKLNAKQREPISNQSRFAFKNLLFYLCVYVCVCISVDAPSVQASLEARGIGSSVTDSCEQLDVGTGNRALHSRSISPALLFLSSAVIF